MNGTRTPRHHGSLGQKGTVLKHVPDTPDDRAGYLQARLPPPDGARVDLMTLWVVGVRECRSHTPGTEAKGMTGGFEFLRCH